MNNEIISDRDYIKAFNQGYELSKELGLKPDILKDLTAGNNRIHAMRDGMEQYGKEISLDKDIIPPLDLDSIKIVHDTIDNLTQEKDREIDMEP